MSMPRDPVFVTSEPSHNLIPTAGNAIWFPLHDSSLLPGVPSLPTMAEVGTPSGSKWGTAGLYTFQTTNTTNVLNALDDDDDRYMDGVLSLVSMTGHLIVAFDVSYTDAPGGTSCVWWYGRNSIPASALALSITSSEGPQFLARGRGNSAGTSTTTNLTATSGTWTQFKNQGRFSAVLGIRPTTSVLVDVELRLGNGSLSAIYTGTDIDVVQASLSGTHPPGANTGITMADFGGLTFGGRNASSVGTYDNFWGRGGTNVGRVGNFQARKYATYSSTRVTEKLAKMLARPRDFVLED